MKFYSTETHSPDTTLKEAVLNGLAPDGGLYMPFSVPRLPEDILSKAGDMTFQEIALEASKLLFMPEIPEDQLKLIVREAFNFPVPLTEIKKDIYVLELFHGPTCAFKDFAARFMARLFGHFAEDEGVITVLTATSGDTGSAVAHGFLGVKNIQVVILYPSGKVSPLQEKQLTGMGGNITALEVKGSFDDCQRMAKEAFMDKTLREKIRLASANSINIARLLPQSFYYIYASSRLARTGKPVAVSVPSGNFGNLTAGIIAKKMGAPISRFIASTNENDVVPEYLKTGAFRPRPSVSTISNAMDVGNPSNFPRLAELFGNNTDKMRNDIYGTSFSDEKTRQAISLVFQEHGYILDPHGAVAYLGLSEFMEKYPGHTGVFLETAHPAKFSEVVEKVINMKVPMPERLEAYLEKEKKAILLENDYSELKKFLLSREG